MASCRRGAVRSRIAARSPPQPARNTGRARETVRGAEQNPLPRRDGPRRAGRRRIGHASPQAFARRRLISRLRKARLTYQPPTARLERTGWRYRSRGLRHLNLKAPARRPAGTSDAKRAPRHRRGHPAGTHGRGGAPQANRYLLPPSHGPPRRRAAHRVRRRGASTGSPATQAPRSHVRRSSAASGGRPSRRAASTAGLIPYSTESQETVSHRTYRHVDTPVPYLGLTWRQWLLIVGCAALALGVIHILHPPTPIALWLATILLTAPVALSYFTTGATVSLAGCSSIMLGGGSRRASCPPPPRSSMSAREASWPPLRPGGRYGRADPAGAQRSAPPSSGDLLPLEALSAEGVGILQSGALVRWIEVSPVNPLIYDSDGAEGISRAFTSVAARLPDRAPEP